MLTKMGEQTCRAISREMLNPGDHICTERWKGLYYHHGIYVGDGMVIHVVRPRNETGHSAKKFRFASFNSSSSGTKLCSSQCQNYGSKKGLRGGTIKTCLDCFLDGHSLNVYDYECNAVRRYVQGHGGAVNSPSRVVKLAYNELQRNYFGAGYDLFGSNCEHFATYCKTSLAFSMQAILWMAKITGFVKGQKPLPESISISKITNHAL